MKKIIYFVCLGLFMGCNSDNDPPSSVLNEDVLVKRIVHSSEESPNDTTYYNYTGKKITSITYSSSDNTRLFTYTGDLITKIQTYRNFTSALVQDETLTYDSRGRLSVHLQTRDTEPGFLTRTVFTYNSNNTVTSVMTNESAFQPSYINNKRVFRLSNGEVRNVDNISYTHNLPGYSYTQTYQYDSKNNPFRNIIGFEKLNLLNDYILTGNTRNVLSIRFSNETPNPNVPSVVRDNSYNEWDFPVTSVTTWSGVNLSTAQYFYE